MSNNNQFTRRSLLKTAGGIALVSGISAPAILRAQTADVIKIGHLTPRTGFLGPLGEYAVMAADLAVEEINAAGGMMGRKVELLKEDSVNPQTASTKAERMIERDKVACIIGEISSASCLTIAQVASRTKTLFINTGGNSDALRGKDCQRYMFHVESQNSMYVKTVGRSFLRDGLVKGKKWYSLTADYAFGHDLLKVVKALHGSQWRQFRRRRSGADRRHRLLRLSAQDPRGQARPGRDQSRRQPDHQLPQAICRVRPDLPGRRLRLRHRAGLGGRQGQLRRHLAGGLASSARHARLQGVRRGLHQEVQASRRRTRPGATTSPSRSWPRPSTT